jgi:hypothetical protein
VALGRTRQALKSKFVSAPFVMSGGNAVIGPQPFIKKNDKSITDPYKGFMGLSLS